MAPAAHAMAGDARGRRTRGPAWCDPWLPGAALALLLLGLVMVASASVSVADRNLGEPLYYFWRQLTFVGAGLAIAAGVACTPIGVWQRLSAPILVTGIVLLALVLVPGVGREVNGSMRWLLVGQPSEFMKLAVVLYLAAYLVRRNDEVRTALRGFLKPLAVLVVIAVLLLLEPDYGATVVLFSTVLGMLFLGGVPLRRFAAWLLAVLAVLGGIVVAAPYRMERLLAFVNPWSDPFGSGFQLTQALIAFGRGEWFGVGLGGSVQKLFYLPEAHTDFVFAVLGEELGLAGSLAVIAAYAFVVWRALAIGARAERLGHRFAAWTSYGIGLGIGLQAFTNIGVNVGVLPTKGLTLPLMSYGGSSMLVMCFAIGLLIRADHESRFSPPGSDASGRAP